MSKGTKKRKINEMLTIQQKDRGKSTKTLDRPMIGLWDFVKIWGTLNEIISLIIIASIRRFDVSKILIDGGISCHITIYELFEKVSLERGSLSHPFRYFELMIFIGEGKDV